MNQDNDIQLQESEKESTEQSNPSTSSASSSVQVSPDSTKSLKRKIKEAFPERKKLLQLLRKQVKKRKQQTATDTENSPSSSSDSDSDSSSSSEEDNSTTEKTTKQKQKQTASDSTMSSEDPNNNDNNNHDANSALQNLLRSLAGRSAGGGSAGLNAMLEDLLMGGGGSTSASGLTINSSRVKEIIEGLKDNENEMRQLEAVSELCNLISIGSEETIAMFRVDSLIPELVKLLRKEHNYDLMLLSARALTHIMDAAPNTCSVVVHAEGIPALCEKLLNIEFIDLAEQCLQAIEKLSYDHGAALLKEGALMAMLQFLDFFSIGLQRTALNAAANICRRVTSTTFHLAADAIPILTNYLTYADQRLVESAIKCFSKLVTTSSVNETRLETICASGLISNLFKILSSIDTPGHELSSATFTSVLGILATLARSSFELTRTLLHEGIADVLKSILAPSSSSTVTSPQHATSTGLGTTPPQSPELQRIASSSTKAKTVITRTVDQVNELLSLINELLPYLSGANALMCDMDRASRKSYLRKLQQTPATPTTPSQPVQTETSENSGTESPTSPASPGTGDWSDDTASSSTPRNPKEAMYKSDPELLATLARNLFAPIMQLYNSTVNSGIRHRSLSVIGKFIHFADADTLRVLLKSIPVSTFLASLLSSTDMVIAASAVQICEMLMTKLPDIFSVYFVREGVTHQLSKLSVIEVPKDFSAAFLKGTPTRQETPQRVGSFSSFLSSVFGASLASQAVSGSPTTQQPTTPTTALGQISAPELLEFVVTHAKTFLEQYFSEANADSSTGAETAVVLSKLKSLTQRLTSLTKSNSSAIEAESVFKDFCALLLSEDGVSTFELLNSGFTKAFISYLLPDQQTVPPEELVQRSHVFCRVFDSTKSTKVDSGDSQSVSCFHIFVKKLQGCIEVVENLPVLTNESSEATQFSISANASLQLLGHPFKIKLQKLVPTTASSSAEAGKEKSVAVEQQYPAVDAHVMVTPLASVNSIIDFLQTKSLQAKQLLDKQKKKETESPSPTSKTATTTTTTSDSSEDSAKTKSDEQTAKSSDSDMADVTSSSAAAEQSDSKADVDMILDADAHLEDDYDEDEEQHDEHEHEHEEEDDFDDLTGTLDGEYADEEDYQAQAAATSDVPTPPTTPSPALSPRGFGQSASSAFQSTSSRSPASSSSASTAAVPAKPRLRLQLNGHTLPASMSLLQAVYAFGNRTQGESEAEQPVPTEPVHNYLRRLWQKVYTFNYMEVDETSEHIVDGALQPPLPLATGTTSETKRHRNAAAIETDFMLSQIVFSKRTVTEPVNNTVTHNPLAPLGIAHNETLCELLEVLRILNALNNNAQSLPHRALTVSTEQQQSSDQTDAYLVPPRLFLSRKLTAKVTRQIHDPLLLCSGSLPSWCTQLAFACPFLFPFEIRRLFFSLTSFGCARAIKQLQERAAEQQGSSNTANKKSKVVRIERQKVRLSRKRLLESAIQVMRNFGSERAFLEFEYFGEVGSGLGPTLEFYTLVSRELLDSRLKLWIDEGRDEQQQQQQQPQEEQAASGKLSLISASANNNQSSNSSNIVVASRGLYPRPLPSLGNHHRTIEYFRFMGTFVARALYDGRLIDLPLSNAFLKLIRNSDPLSFADLRDVVPELYKQLAQMLELVAKKQELENDKSLTEEEKQRRIADLRLNEARIEDLCLDFTLPGYADIALKEGGENITVTIWNLAEYIELVTRYFLYDGIVRQVDAFRAGFDRVFPLRQMQLFSIPELEELLCGCVEKWTVDLLESATKCDHGYSHGSRAVQYLFTIMSEMDSKDQRMFLRFVTGSPKLPPGGIKCLSPKLTIVRKTVQSSQSAANTTTEALPLPSVMTCANYLKLPDYSDFEVMKAKLYQAIHEGQSSFHLS